MCGKMIKEITQAELREIVHYDQHTGLFTWAKRLSNRIRIGSVAGSITTHGYVMIRINGKNCFAHRLVWLYVHGFFPENDIDHIDRVRHNNSLGNLREVSRSCNIRNSGLRSGNTSGIKGVYFDSLRGKWRSQISVNNKNIHLGIFDKKIDAAKSRHAAEMEYKYTECNNESSALKYIASNNN